MAASLPPSVVALVQEASVGALLAEHCVLVPPSFTVQEANFTSLILTADPAPHLIGVNVASTGVSEEVMLQILMSLT